MRVLILNHEYPPVGGGGGNATWFTAREMARLGLDVRIVTTSFRDLPSFTREDDVDVIRVPALRSKALESKSSELISYACSATIRAFREVSRWQPALIQTYFGIPAGAVGYTLKMAQQKPYVISFRGRDVHGGKGEDGPGIEGPLRTVSKVVWSAADALVANSIGLRDVALRVLPGADVDVIPNGVDTETFQLDRKERLGSDRFCILYVGRLEPYKGVADLIEALSILNDPTICLKIAGDGSLNQVLRQQAKDLGLNDRVAFMGGIRKQEMPDVYSSADALCLPSIVEGMSNVVLEAMASGLPVVVTDIPGSRDLVQNDRSGLIVPPSEPGKVAEALQKLASNAETRKRFSAAARIKAGEMSWKKVAEDYIAIYERVLRGSSVVTA